MKRGPDAASAMGRAMAKAASDAGLTLAIDGMRSEAWASATFSGERLALSITLADGPAARRWLGGLAETEWALPGHLVADLSVLETAGDAANTTARIEILTLAAA